MPKLIQDRFSSVPSRQRRYQLRREAAGLCRLCGQPAVEGKTCCPTHLEQHRAFARTHYQPVATRVRPKPVNPQDCV